MDGTADLEGFEELAQVGKAVTIFGSARRPSDDPYYEKARETTRLLSEAGYAIITGAGPEFIILVAFRRNNPAAKVVYARTRQVYGRPDYLPVDERHLVRPSDVNGINKVAGEYYHLVYNNVFGVRACSLRLTNVYGPRQLVRHNCQGFIGWFLPLVIEDGEIQIFGDGSQVRDFVYVDDAADAFLRAGATDAVNGEVFNVGGSEPIAHRDLVTLLIGVNNQYRGRSEEEYHQQFRSLLQRAITYAGNDPTRVIVLSIPDWSVTPFARHWAPNSAVWNASPCRSIGSTASTRPKLNARVPTTSM